MRIPLLLAAFCTLVPTAAGLLMLYDSDRERGSIELLNVSYDPTRELWRAINARFSRDYEARTGQRIAIRQSHGGSASQARSLIDGLQADVVTLALWNDTDALRSKKLLAADWENRLPNRSVPYHSTIVFVVRQGNPKHIHDWPDLIRDGVEVITPNPKTSGNGKLSFLAAWGAVRRAGGSDADALNYVAELYRHVPILDTGARGATTTFAQNGRGDVHLTWENEAMLEVAESKSGLEVVYPPRSILAEPPVAVVDAVATKRGTRAISQAYLEYLYRPEIQDVIAEHGFRPINQQVIEKHRTRFPPLELFPITAVATDWSEAQARFFDADGVFDSLFTPRAK